MKAFKNFWFDILWGDNAEQYNTVVHSTIVPFWVMQLSRLIMFIVLLVISLAYFYIYVRTIFTYFQCFVLLFSTLAFFFLFIGAGKQKCYQYKVANKEKYGINYSDTSKKENLWMAGVFFYGQAFSLAIIGTFIYFVPYRKWITNISEYNY